MSVLPESNVISFARGIPSPDMFPLAKLAESARRAVERDGRVALNYGPPCGFGPLRRWLGDRHGVPPERVIVTPGSLIGLNFLVSHVFRAGGRAVVEAPTYDRMLHALGAAGADVLTVDRDHDGLDLDRLRELAAGTPRPGVLYVLPTFHNPTGRTLTLEQRRRLAELAVEHELLVFEDDPYGLLRVEGEPLPSVHELLRAGGGDHLAVFSSSFSKTVAPGLRVGYLILPEALVSPVEALATRTYVSPPLLAQAQLHDFLAAGGLEPQLEFLRSFLRLRRDALLEVLEEELPGEAAWTRPEGGYFLWLELPEAIDATELNERARAAGVAFVPGSAFFLGDRGRSTARLSFSFPSVDEIREGAHRLGGLVREALQTTAVREGPR
ncbi:MAG: PLP-dependent aminotransferase family protein [Gaiellaceae bacterium]